MKNHRAYLLLILYFALSLSTFTHGNIHQEKNHNQQSAWLNSPSTLLHLTELDLPDVKTHHHHPSIIFFHLQNHRLYVTHKPSYMAIFSYAVQDAFDRIATVTSKEYVETSSNHPTPKAVTYYYDALGRRIAYVYDGTSNSEQWKVPYDYCLQDNRV